MEGEEKYAAGILFIISAPSGSGKSTLVSELRKQVKDVDFSISWTTRPPRGSEENGREYNFTSKEEFERMRHECMRKSGNLVEMLEQLEQGEWAP